MHLAEHSLSQRPKAPATVAETHHDCPPITVIALALDQTVLLALRNQAGHRLFGQPSDASKLPYSQFVHLEEWNQDRAVGGTDLWEACGREPLD